MTENTLLALIGNLIERESVSPNDGGTIDYIKKALTPIGFVCRDINVENVTNLYAKLDLGGKNFCFAGHLDVVPPGDRSAWSANPFKMTITDSKRIMGRGIVDMKGAVGCFVHALQRFLKKHNPKFSISLLLTSDEEAVAKYGTTKVMEAISADKEKIDYCLIGEMTSKDKFCDCIKIGRRGSLDFELAISGTQGHVAYPKTIDNPIHRLTRIMTELSAIKLDNGNAFFEPSGLQITDIESNNTATNVCPSLAIARFNVRYNNSLMQHDIYDIIYGVCTKYAEPNNVKLVYPEWNAHHYLSKKQGMANIIADVVEELRGYRPILDTTGGATDGRFIANYCDNVAELGFIEHEAHKIDESCDINEVYAVEEVYFGILEKMQSLHQAL